jgi:hypothetical protein
MQRSEIVSLAKSLLDEKGSLYFTDALMNTLADEANKDVYRILIRVCPDHLLDSKEFTWTSGAERMDMDTVLGTDGGTQLRVYKLLGIESTESSGGVTSDNLPTKWMPMRFTDRSKLLRSGGVSGVSNVGYASRHYALQDKYIYCAPIPQAALNVNMYYIRDLFPFSSDSAHALNNRAHMFHDAVYKRLAVLMNAKQNGNNPVVDRLWQEAVVFMENNAESRYSDEPQSVRVLGHY